MNLRLVLCGVLLGWAGLGLPEVAGRTLRPGLFDTTAARERTPWQVTDSCAVLRSSAFRIAGVGAGLLAGSALVHNTNLRFKELHDQVIPDFHSRYDDWLQYAPAAVMIGLKAAGVQGRSSWGRMLTSDAFSVATMAILVNSLKYTVKKERPDGLTANSYPSGHSATAFMTATMLSREYGGRSVWYSVGAYTAATAVSVGRWANNRHWVGDLLAGAGLGIISTEFGYWIADQIFKERGINGRYDRENLEGWPSSSSFVGIYLGSRTTLGKYRLEGGEEAVIGTGSMAALEGAWFFSRYVGVGGRLALASLPVAVRGTHRQYLYQIAPSVGGYFSCPLEPFLSLGGRIAVGYSHSQPGKSTSVTVPLVRPNGLTLESGLAAQLHVRRHFSFRLSLDYQAQTSPLRRSQWLHSLCYGASANVQF